MFMLWHSLGRYEPGMILSTIRHHGHSVVVIETQSYPYSVRTDAYDMGYNRRDL